MWNRKQSFFAAYFWAILLSLLTQAQAAAKKPESIPPVLDGKRVVEILPVQGAELELPDQTFHRFGEDFEASLITRLTQSGRFIVTQSVTSAREALSMPPDEHYHWLGSTVPSVRVRVEVSALNFVTGSRGDRTFYGFDEHFRNPYNSGSPGVKNEFPLRSWFGSPSWFGHTFDSQGVAPWDSLSGLDLGEGFGLNALFAWLKVKYASYQSELHLKLHFEVPEIQGHSWSWRESEFRIIEVQGQGFYFDVAGGYQNYSAAIRLARRDALLQALKQAIDQSVSAVERALRDPPLMAQVDAILSQDLLLIGTGRNAQVQPGVQYEDLSHPGQILEVIRSEPSGSLARLKSGSPDQIQLKDLLRQVPSPRHSRDAQSSFFSSSSLLSSSSASSSSPLPLSSSSVSSSFPSLVDRWTLPFQTFKPITLPLTEWSAAEVFLKSLLDGVFLPYRIVRYFQYDQSYHASPDLLMAGSPQENLWKKQIGLIKGGRREDDLSRFSSLDSSSGLSFPSSHSSYSSYSSFPLSLLAQPLDHSAHFASRSSAPVVAILDTGVDYNHPWIHSSLSDDDQQRGWDFISHDPRAYDDHFHGTELASLVLQVAPEARILPIKVFNPWGVTHSAALYQGFHYAITHGADFILCGWSTLQFSQALEDGVALAQMNHVPVITAAGDLRADLTETPMYPASFSRRYSSLLSVAAVDSEDHLWEQGGLGSNFGVEDVQIAAPGVDLLVAQPRGGWSHAHSSTHAAAIVVGALARYAIALRSTVQDPTQLIPLLLQDAEEIPSLRAQVASGRRLKLRF